MDEACGLRKKEESFVPADLHQGTAEVASWNKRKVGLNIGLLGFSLTSTMYM